MWLQVIIKTDTSTAETISDALFAIGAVSVSLTDAEDEPLYEPPLNTTPLWEQVRVIALFEDGVDCTYLQAQLQTTLAPLPVPPWQIEELEDQDWSRVWMDDFQPMRFGERVWICPSWLPPPDPQAVNILLDPGLAFGTGLHPTTALCLEWLDKQVDLTGKIIIDYGCGSGILAITASKLGAKHVWAVDNDPQALLATQDNAQKNNVETTISCMLPEQLPKIEADGMLANILANPLINLAPTFATHLKPNAALILSGILTEQTNDVIAAYTPFFTITEVMQRDEWVRIDCCCGNRFATGS
jgi:ribosomal protein L11 methyltransferase